MTTTKFLTPFATDGDKSEIPGAIQSDGSISLPEGWGFDYSRNPSTDPLAKRIDRAAMNWLFYAITQALGQIQQTGAPEWITAADNGGTAFEYEQGAIVRYSGVTYGSLVGTNTATPGTDPTKWAVLDLSLFAPLASPAFTGTPTVPTAAPGTNTTQAASTAFVTGAIAGISLAGYAQLAAAQLWMAPQTPDSQALVDAATVTIVITRQVWKLSTAAVRTIGAPTGGVSGTSYRLELTSNGYTPSWNTIFKFPGGILPTALTGLCIFDFYYDGANYHCVGQSIGEA